MAAQRIARIIETKQLNSETKLLNLSLSDGELLNFIGGQYVIVNTNIQLPGGKIAKRAYSILSSDTEQSRFQIAVKKLGTGPGSNYMHQTQIGSELPFSGPWGQFFTDESTSSNSTLVLATDTGITAALGLIQSSRFKTQVKETYMVWMIESDNAFIPKSFVENILSSNGTNFEIKIVPPPGHADRFKISLDFLKAMLDQKRMESVFLSGDGDLLYPFKDELLSRGILEKQIKIECFFNNPFKKITS